MKTKSDNRGTTRFTFPCYSNEGIFPCEAEGSAALRKFLEEFGTGCCELKHIAIKSLRLFAGMLPEAVASAGTGEDTLLDVTTFWNWFRFWRRAGEGRQEYNRRELIYVAVYVVRWFLDRDVDTAALPAIVGMARGKELATFLLDEWTDTGEVCVAQTSDGDRTVIREFRFANGHLSELYRRWFASGIATVRVSEFDKFSGDFEQSLGPYVDDITSIRSFGEETLFEQVGYYNDQYADNPVMNRRAIRHVVGFYRFLTEQRGGHGIFDGGTMTRALLEKKSVIGFLMEGWGFVAMHEVGTLSGTAKAVVVLEGYMPLGTRYAPGETIPVNLSSVESPFYRRLIWRYLARNLKVMIAGRAGTLAFTLHVLEAARGVRGQDGRPFDNEDLLLMRVAVLDQNITDETVVMMLSTIRQFVKWLVDDPGTETDPDICPDLLMYHRERGSGRTPVKAIPLEDFRLVMNYLKEQSKTSYRALVIHNMLWIMVATGIRPSAACIMKLGAIHPFPREGYCLVYGPNKPSRGEQDVWVFNSKAVEWLDEVLQKSIDLRDECSDPELREYVFIYRSATGICRLKEGELKAEVVAICEKLGLPAWTPYDFRKLFGTTADELDRLMGCYGELASQMMGHRHYKTTREHYVDATFEAFSRGGEPEMISTDEMMMAEYLRLCGRKNDTDN